MMSGRSLPTPLERRRPAPSGPNRVTGVPLRRRLFALSAAGTLPLAVLAGAGLYALDRQYDAQAERVGLELARSVANSSTPSSQLDRGARVSCHHADARPRRFRRVPGPRAARRGYEPDWAASRLPRPTARPSSTRAPPAGTAARRSEPASFDRVVAHPRAVVGSLCKRSTGRLVLRGARARPSRRRAEIRRDAP